MKILFESDAVLPVKKYGGIERITYWLMKEFVRRGHEVYYLGPKGCELSKDKIIHIECNKNEKQGWESLIPKEIDMVHLSYEPPADFSFPFLVTTHGNGKPHESFHENTVFLSRKHAAIHSSDVFVYNGIDLSEYPFKNSRESIHSLEKLLFLAKVSWKVKNVNDCIKACKKLNKHLYIAGGKKLSFSKYIHNLGFIDQEQKLNAMESVDAFLWPVRWHEPFGLAVIEAMAQGLPVIASPFGSLSELVTEESGVLCCNYEEFENALSKKTYAFKPAKIRSYVEANYSISKCADNYLALYTKILDGENLQSHRPFTISSKDPESLLDF